jgi:hypothetical protein
LLDYGWQRDAAVPELGHKLLVHNYHLYRMDGGGERVRGKHQPVTV